MTFVTEYSQKSVIKMNLLMQFILIAILVTFVNECNAKPTVGPQKKIRCFRPSKPEDMPQDVYDKYKISSKNLNEKDKKEFWQKFTNWWKNMFAQIGQFFQKVGQFFKNLFAKNSGQDQQSQTTNPTTEAPPTPDPNKVRNNKQELICIEYEDTTDPNIGQKTAPTKLTTKESITTVPSTVKTTEVVANHESNENPESTPYDPNGEHENKVTVIIGLEQKARPNLNTDPTVVKDV